MQEGHVRLVEHTLRWHDLLSPRALVEFTLGDAVGSLPTLLAMAGFFLLGIAILLIAKRVLQWVLLRFYYNRFLVYDSGGAGNRKAATTFRPKIFRAPSHPYATFANLFITSLFLAGLGVLAVFTAAIGGINLWASPLTQVGMGLIGTYVFGVGLQQVGSYYFVLWFGGMSYGEYWSLVGSPVEGRVSHITPFFIELSRLDTESQSAVTYRVSMSTVLQGMWERNYKKDFTAPHAEFSEPPGGAIVLAETKDGAHLRVFPPFQAEKQV